MNNDKLNGEYTPLYVNHKLNVLEALDRVEYWTGQPTELDRPYANGVVKLLLHEIRKHYQEESK